MQKNLVMKVAPIIFSFFVMGYVDIVGIATNYVKKDFGLSDTMANACGSMLFFWFLVLSVPTGILMGKFGRRNTVVLSMAISVAALVVPIIDYSMPAMFASFALLGIGNTLLQVSVNPLLADVVSGGALASTITFGQFVKSIAAFIGPIIAIEGAKYFGDWKTVYPVFAAAGILPVMWLAFQKIGESRPAKNSSFTECMGLLKNPLVAMFFVGILVHVGVDVGVNMTSPKILVERARLTLEDAGYITSFYFLFKTAASFAGAIVLARISSKKFFIFNVAIMFAAVSALLLADTKTAIYACVAIIGIGNANIFSVIFAKALQYMPSRKNEISGLMVMGIAGGGVFPVFMGIASDAVGSQIGAVSVVCVCVLYLAALSFAMKD